MMDVDSDLEDFTPSSQQSYLAKKKGKQKNKEVISVEKGYDQMVYSKEGLLFSSDKKIEEYLDILDEKYDELYYQRDCKKKEKYLKSKSQQKRKNANDNVKYYTLTYWCIFTTQEEFKGTGQRECLTRKFGCPGKMHFCITECGNFYKLSVFKEHNCHERVTPEMLNHISERRKLKKQLALKVLEDIQNKMPNLLIQHNLLEQGIIATGKDISNKRYEARVEAGYTDNLKDFCSILAQNGADYSIRVVDNEFRGLYFCTQTMRDAFIGYPEIIFVDSTYEIFRLGYSLTLITVEDSNGQTELVSAGILHEETEDNMTWFVEKLIERNEEACSRVNCIMADKDGVIRKVFRLFFHNVPILICIFHARKAIGNAITYQEMEIDKKTKEKLLDLISNMMYSESDLEYNFYFDKFQQSAPANALQYFDKNWHNIQTEWCVRFMVNGNFNNTTNNRLESFNHTLKQAIDINLSLVEFGVKFFMFYKINILERNAKAANALIKIPSAKPNEQNQILNQYRSLVTPFAFNHIQKQYESRTFVVIVNDRFGKYETKSSFMNRTVTLTSCSCRDFQSMGLPCRHIFKVREFKKVNLFSNDIVKQRWLVSYYKEHQRVLKPSNDIENNMFSNEHLNLEKVIVSKKIKRGRPKGSKKKDTIGRPVKMRRLNKGSDNNTITSDHEIDDSNEELTSDNENTNEIPPSNDVSPCFSQQEVKSQALILLKLLINPDILDSIVKKLQIGRKIIVSELSKEYVQCHIFAELKRLPILKSFMTPATYTKLEDIIEKGQDNVFYVCAQCKEDLLLDASISCDLCLCWFHFHCVNISEEPRGKFFCPQCS